MSQEALSVESLALRYPNNGNLMGPWTFSLGQGQTGALCGPSGCGKTTVLYCFAGLYPEGFGIPDIWGACVVTTPVDLLIEKSFLQVLGPTVRDELKAAEAVSWLPPDTKKYELQWLLEAFLLDTLWDRPIRELSQGERQKLALACLLLRSPALLLLDQPASSLDLQGQAALKEAIQRATLRGDAVLLADPDWMRITPTNTEELLLFPKASSPTRDCSEQGLLDETAREQGRGETLMEFEGLDIRRGGRTVLRDISGKVPRGAIILVAGDNGSGKTSLLLTLAGLLKPSKGRVRHPSGHKRRSGWIRPSLMLQETLWHMSGKTVAAELQWAWQKPGRRDGLSPAQVVSLLGLEGLLHKPGHLLSRGEMQRVALAMTILRNSPVVCLDEPFRFLWDHEREMIIGFLQTAKRLGLSFLIASPVDDTVPWADQVWRLPSGRAEIC